MRLPSSWQAPPPTPLRIRWTLLGTGRGRPTAGALRHGLGELGLKQPQPFSPRKALPGRPISIQAVAPRNFGRNLRLITAQGLTLCSSALVIQKKKSSFHLTRKPGENQGLQE